MILYLQSHRRRPIRLSPLLPHQDAQGAVPAGWCGVCGGEIYEEKEKLCYECKKERMYESELRIESLPGVHPCGGS